MDSRAISLDETIIEKIAKKEKINSDFIINQLLNNAKDHLYRR